MKKRVIPVKSGICFRCERKGHIAEKCTETHHIDGSVLGPYVKPPPKKALANVEEAGEERECGLFELNRMEDGGCDYTYADDEDFGCTMCMDGMAAHCEQLGCTGCQNVLFGHLEDFLEVTDDAVATAKKDEQPP